MTTERSSTNKNENVMQSKHTIDKDYNRLGISLEVEGNQQQNKYNKKWRVRIMSMAYENERTYQLEMESGKWQTENEHIRHDVNIQN